MKSNNEQGLQKKMDTLDTLSAGFVFDKDGAWDKLQSKLEAKPRRKVLPIYWMSAAACLLVMFLVFNNRGAREEHTVATPVIVIQPHKDATGPVATVVTRQSDIAVHVPYVHITKKGTSLKKEGVVATQYKDIPLIKEEVQQTAIPIPDSHPQRMAVAKKKWKVVHINEVVTEEENIKTIVKENRMAGIKFLPRYRNDIPAQETEDNSVSKNLLQFKLN